VSLLKLHGLLLVPLFQILAFSLHWQPNGPRFLNPAAFLVANPLPDSGEASFHQEFAGPATFVLVPGWLTIRLAPGSDI
jgi:hypothetical protein